MQQSQSQLAQGIMQGRKEILEECRPDLHAIEAIEDEEFNFMLRCLNELDYAMRGTRAD